MVSATAATAGDAPATAATAGDAPATAATAGDASSTTARVCRATTAGDASNTAGDASNTTATGAPSTATRADYSATGIPPSARASSTLSVRHDDGPGPAPLTRHGGAAPGTVPATGAPILFPASESIPAKLTR